MVNTYLENKEVEALRPEYDVQALEARFKKEIEEQREQYDAKAKEKKTLKDKYSDLLHNGAQGADYTERDLFFHKDKLSGNMHENVVKAVDSRNNAKMLKMYGEAFAHLYQVKESEERFGSDVKMTLKEIELPEQKGILTQEQHFEMSANPEGVAMQPALEVVLDDNTTFNITMMQYDKPGSDKKEVKAQISLPDEAMQNMNVAKLASIVDFCETHGLSVFNMEVPYSYDGSIDVDAKFAAMLEEVKKLNAQNIEQKANEEVVAQEQRQQVLEKEAETKGVSMEGISNDLPQSSEIFSGGNEEPIREANASGRATGNAPSGQKKGAKNKKTKADAEKGFEDFFEKGLGKTRGFSYFKEHTGWFGTGWTEYILYETNDVNNRKEDGKRDKNKKPRYTYTAKIFLKQEKDGRFRFAYRAPAGKKVDDGIINGMIGQFKSLGITHVKFPDGLKDSEKKLWRTSLAENGIVPVGMGLDKAKAEAMLKAAKEKLSEEKYSQFKYKLALQMEADNKAKGKKVDDSEQSFIDGLKNAHYYDAFTNGYALSLKSMLRDEIDKSDVNREDGAVRKTAAYMALRKIFDVYKETLHADNVLASSQLSNDEKRDLQAAGLTMPVQDMNTEQMTELYKIMQKHSYKEAKDEIDTALADARDAGNTVSKGAKRADNVIIKEVFDGARGRFEKINEMLKSLGCDELDFPKSFGRLHYDKVYREHPEWRRKNPTQNSSPTPSPTPSPAPTPTPARSQRSAGRMKIASGNTETVKLSSQRKRVYHKASSTVER